MLVFYLFFNSYLYASNQSPKIPELVKSEIGKLERHELIIKKDPVKDSPWPEVTVFALIKATPLEAVSIFAAYDYQKEYIPRLIKSRPVKHVSPTEVWTAYEMDLPWPMENSHYTHGAKISQKKDDVYQVDWYMVESDNAEEVKGRATFSPYKNETLMRYQTFIRPRSFFARFVSRTMLSDLQKSIHAIVEHTELAKKSKQEVLQKYINYIRRALKGEAVYEATITSSKSAKKK